MKIDLVFLCVFLVGFYMPINADGDMTNEVLQQCMTEENINEDQIQKAIKAGKYHTLNCLQSCMLTYYTIMKDGRFDLKVLHTFLKIHIDIIIKTIIGCSEEVSQQKNVDCDIPLRLQDCIMREMSVTTVVW